MRFDGMSYYATNGVLNTATNDYGLEAWFRPDYGWPFKGSIDEVAIYNRAISPAEIHAHYIRALRGPSETVIFVQ